MNAHQSCGYGYGTVPPAYAHSLGCIRNGFLSSRLTLPICQCHMSNLQRKQQRLLQESCSNTMQTRYGLLLLDQQGHAA